jgi:hypothetical protein
MRDIRQDLRDRLKELDASISHLEATRRTLLELLESEEKRWTKSGDTAVLPRGEPVPTPLSTPTPTLKEVIEEILDNGEIWSSMIMAQAAAKRGCDFRGSAPGRAVQAILLNMLRSGQVESVGDGKWRLKQETFAS